MPNLKPPLTFEELIIKLKELNLSIPDEDLSLEALKSIGYYRLSGYSLEHRIKANSSEYKEGTDFSALLEPYRFDCELRSVLRKYIEIVEVYFRAQIANIFSTANCSLPPHDQHYDSNNFLNAERHKELFKRFEKNASTRYRDDLIINHHLKKYGGKMPLWVIVEFLSFSDLSMLYSNMLEKDQILISKAFNTGRNQLSSHLHCLSTLRNKCAHAARLYNATLRPVVKLSKSFKMNNPSVKNDSLFCYILILLKYLPSRSTKIDFVEEIVSLVDKYKTFINPGLMGFPVGYEFILKKYSDFDR